MRCGIYSLAGLVANSLKQNPLNGDVFIFIGKAGNQIRLLQWDKDGYALYIKRLETGTFERPGGDKLQLSSQELMLILEGIKLNQCSSESGIPLPKVLNRAGKNVDKKLRFEA